MTDSIFQISVGRARRGLPRPGPRRRPSGVPCIPGPARRALADVQRRGPSLHRGARDSRAAGPTWGRRRLEMSQTSNSSSKMMSALHGDDTLMIIDELSQAMLVNSFVY